MSGGGGGGGGLTIWQMGGMEAKGGDRLAKPCGWGEGAGVDRITNGWDGGDRSAKPCAGED